METQVWKNKAGGYGLNHPGTELTLLLLAGATQKALSGSWERRHKTTITTNTTTHTHTHTGKWIAEVERLSPWHLGTEQLSAQVTND